MTNQQRLGTILSAPSGGFGMYGLIIGLEHDEIGQIIVALVLLVIATAIYYLVANAPKNHQ